MLLLLMIIFKLDGHNIRSSGGRTTKEIPCDYYYYYYHISCALGKVKSKRPRLSSIEYWLWRRGLGLPRLMAKNACSLFTHRSTVMRIRKLFLFSFGYSRGPWRRGLVQHGALVIVD